MTRLAAERAHAILPGLMTAIAVPARPAQRIVARVVRHPGFAAWAVTTIVLLVASTWALRYSAAHLPPTTVRATVHRALDFSDPPVLALESAPLDPAACAKAAGLNPEEPFAVEWQGTAIVTEAGTHRVRALVDDGIAVWIDGELLLEQSVAGLHELSAPVTLQPGLHPIRMRYVQRGADARFRFSWARPSWREHFHPVPIVATSSDLVFRRVLKATRYPIVVATAWSVWFMTGLAIVFYSTVSRVAPGSCSESPSRGQYLAAATAAVAVLGFGVHIGTEPWRGWAPDEVTPKHALYAAGEWFSGGWTFLYPPFHFYLLSILVSPFMALASWNWLDLWAPDTENVMHVISRVFTVLMAGLLMVVTALIARRDLGQGRALLAALLLLTVPSFVFYSKTTNVDVPYLLWVAVSMLLFLRAAETRAVVDHAALGAAVALAVTTKDQAYGFFPGAAAVLLWLAWRETSQRLSITRRVMATALDRRLWAGAATCLVLYVSLVGIIWNPQGVRGHFDLVLTAESFRMFPRTPRGFIELAWTTAGLLPSTLGPLCTAFGLIGFFVALRSADRFRSLLLLLPLALSYAFFVIGLIGYVYDRFLLGLAIVAVLFAALGLDSTFRLIPRTTMRAAFVALCLLVGLAQPVLINWRIATDSRLKVEAWMQQHLDDDPFVLGVGRQEYLPNLHPFRFQIDISPDSHAVLEWNADVVVLNEQWQERSRRESLGAMTRALRAAGYEERFAVRSGSPSWYEAVLSLGSIDPTFSNLSKVSPPLSVWTRSPES